MNMYAFWAEFEDGTFVLAPNLSMKEARRQYEACLDRDGYVGCGWGPMHECEYIGEVTGYE